jgi:hypothetical protein
MKKIFLYFALLIVMSTVATSCKKESQFFAPDLLDKKDQRIRIEQFLNLDTSSFLKKGYSIEKKLSTPDIICYKLNDTTIFVNEKFRLSKTKNLRSFQNFMKSFTGYTASYTMYGSVCVLSGDMEQEADLYIDDSGSRLDDICFNFHGPDFVWYGFSGGVNFADDQDSQNLWGSPSSITPVQIEELRLWEMTKTY